MQIIKKGWKKVRIGEEVILRQGFCLNAKNAHYKADFGLPLLKIGDLINNTETLFVKENIPEQFKVSENDIIYSRTGQVGLVFKGKKGVIYNNCFRIIPNKTLDSNYLYWFLKSEDIIELARSLATGAAQPDLNHDAFKSIEITFPEDISTQQKIASILSKYDDLIENNNKRIKILEETAQSIYEDWFVKYNFPGSENIKMIDSGNDDFVMIPEGWEVRSILDIDYFRFINENIKKYEGEKVYYATADIDGICITGKGEKFHFNSKPSRAQKEPILNSVWFARMIETFKVLGFTQTNDKIANRSILSSGMVGFEAEEYIFPFLYYTINSKDFHSIKNLYCTGATQRALTNDGLKQIKIIYPNKNIVENYGKLTKSMIDEMFLLQKQNQNLKETRDLLIPRLVSGELDVESLDVKI